MNEAVKPHCTETRIYGNENVNIINRKNTGTTTTIDDLLNGVTGQQKTKRVNNSNNNTLFSLPEIEPQSTRCQHKQDDSILEQVAMRHSRLSWTRVSVRQDSKNRANKTSGVGILAALKTLSQRDVMDALQFTSTHRLFSVYSEDEHTTVAKALVGATSMYVFPLEVGEQEQQKKKKKEKHDALCAEALCSAYDACRSRVFTFDDQDDPTEFILYVYVEGYTVVFQQSERDGILATISRSTPGMRRLFDMYGIKYETIGTKNVFRGARNVHGVFDVLLNSTGSIRKIVAPAPFENASLVKTPFRITSSGSDVVISSSSSNRHDGDDAFIPPWVVSRLQYLLLMSSFSYTISTK